MTGYWDAQDDKQEQKQKQQQKQQQKRVLRLRLSQSTRQTPLRITSYWG
jgi:hypothetical protein